MAQASQNGRAHARGSVTIYAFPFGCQDGPLYDITAGPDGNLWFTDGGVSQIGRVTPSGSFTEYPVPTSDSGPARITTGPDGNLWFTEECGNNIGRVTLASATPT